MNSQAIAMLVIWAVGIGVFLVALIIFRGFLQWLLGISDIIRLLEEQNKLLQAPSARTGALSAPRQNPPTGTALLPVRRPKA